MRVALEDGVDSISDLPEIINTKNTGLSQSQLRTLKRKQKWLKTYQLEDATDGAAESNPTEATLVFTQEEAGTAVCISSDGLLLTCSHCIAESLGEYESKRHESFFLLFSSGRLVRAKSIAWDPKRDLALLQITAAQHQSSPFPHIMLSKEPPKLRAPLSCIGHPGSEDLETSIPGVKTHYDVLVISRGSHRGYARGQDVQDNSEIGAMKHDCWTYWGHSGAPLVARDSGELVGMHSSWDDRTGLRVTSIKHSYDPPTIYDYQLNSYTDHNTPSPPPFYGPVIQTFRFCDPWPHHKRRNSQMKRQKVDEGSPSAEQTALNILLTSEKARVVILIPDLGRPQIRLINEKARELLTQLLEYTYHSTEPMVILFWSAVHAVARREKDSEVLRISNLVIKLRRVVVRDEVMVVVTAKRGDGSRYESSQSFQSGPPQEICALSSAVEDDIIGNVLGINNLILTLVKIEDRGVHRYLCTNSHAAIILGFQPHQVRGRTSLELGQPMADTNRMYDLYHRNLDPQTKISSFSIDLEQIPGASYFSEHREVKPGYLLGLSIIYSRTQQTYRPPGPSPPAIPRIEAPKIWIRNRWDEFMEDCIRYVQHNRHHTSKDRIPLPEEFLINPEKIYCYIYSGESFLPSGDRDGFLWKSSRGTTSAGHLQKRYFYAQLQDGSRLRRKVMWMNDIKELFIIEYRHFSTANSMNTEADKLMGPPGMDWNRLTNEVHSQMNQQLTTSCDVISSHFDMAATRTDPSDLGSDNIVSYVNHILHSWASDFGKSK
ncbi:hypothetical protein PROFUN_05408 [Planoprotostelium fungivorum]|uniref:Uncharacterized protein n=1 Tax=Planoprotostelium fungivorum TaxID=1890364 RepID=A0A2P6NQN8_9EUKA|nr:hypothetical protein PROFUN_05408 [Planoprotostelium fungivorum]